MVVLSTEGLCHHWPRFRSTALRWLGFVTSAVPTEVIVALRDRLSFVESLYKQALENPAVDEDWGLAITIDEFAQRPHVDRVLDYARQLSEIEAALRPQTLTVLPYNMSVVDAFLRALPAMHMP